MTVAADLPGADRLAATAPDRVPAVACTTAREA